MSAFTFMKPILSASYISHSESASGNDASADFTTEADPEIFDPNDYVPHQQELPTKITALSGEVNELKKHIKEFEIELPELFELKKHKWELPKEFLDLPGQISSVHSHIQTLEALPAGKSTALPAKGEKNTNPVTEDAELANLVDLIGIDVVEEYHKKKLLYNKEDGSEEVISNLKVSDLHVKTRVDQLTLLGMIMFNSYHRHDFVTIEDLRDFSNTMLYTVQEIFFKRHQGPRHTDYARTFSAILLAKIDKRNLNPLKLMRTIEQLRQ
ncbi:hypothetical protein Tco_1029510 [Tanacetum coccineum]|uniref:Uncharacterized protein n=1 Tax=Tanacetum coccineum TaxID=301880 RepID=A0ABQ5G3N3_9ASTR